MAMATAEKEAVVSDGVAEGGAEVSDGGRSGVGADGGGGHEVSVLCHLCMCV